MNRFATGIIFVLSVAVISATSFFGVANAYSIYPSTTGSSAAGSATSSALDFSNFSFTNGLNQLAAPFQNFITNAQSDTISFADAGADNVIQSKTMPFMNATMQDDWSDTSNWFYGVVQTQAIGFIGWLKENL